MDPFLLHEAGALTQHLHPKFRMIGVCGLDQFPVKQQPERLQSALPGPAVLPLAPDCGCALAPPWEYAAHTRTGTWSLGIWRTGDLGGMTEARHEARAPPR